MAHLKVDKTSTKVSCEYVDFTDIFSPKLIIKLLEHMQINNHTIKLVDNE